MLDAICWRQYGREDVVSVVLESNTHLAGLPPVLT
ncbi:MAG: tail protein X, partial [Bilophila sp.]